MPTKVTVGISIYNNEKTIKYAIDSILKQTYNDWELILIDDGSTDNSLDIIRTYNDERIKVYTDGENKGLITRLNQMINLCQTDFFFRMDSDDIMHPERIEKQVKFLLNNKDIDLVGAEAIVVDEENKISGIRRNKNIVKSIRFVFENPVFIHPTVAGKTEWFKQHRYDNGFHRCEDFELWCRTIETSNFAHINEPLLFYRDPKKLNKTNYINSLKTSRKVIKKYENSKVYRFKFVIKSLIKENAFKTTILLNLDKLWLKKRNKSYLTDQHVQNEYGDILQGIINP
ncbi:glycosyltransferase [Peribacillus frigoritolerans]|uniref:glycosyltransferase family 2 protein n=1 Tax=Peribacillus frigoritolerans TaxID=450367 RepID=UPI003D2D7696